MPVVESMQNRVFIHATNVHQGGGRSLLGALLKAFDGKVEVVLSLDSRMPVPPDMIHHVEIKRVQPSAVQRLMAERWLARSVGPEDIVLCFGNLPPLFKLRGRAMVFVQNRYLIDDVQLNGFPLRIRLRLAIERLWLSGTMSNASEFIVQTPTMKRLLEAKTQGKAPVRVLPFVAEPNADTHGGPTPEAQKENNYDFVYVASGEPHKNHWRLIEAWCLLAEEGLFPSLCLTLDEARFAALYTEIDAVRQRYGLKITNKGELPHNGILGLYDNASALIYPSAFESFGLPLVEARQAGLSVLAAELDYVRDVLDPEQTFDPDSPVSIARAVKRHLGVVEAPLKIVDAVDFLDMLINRRS
ncbi:MAG: glycosyltransferase [Methylobacter sp.]